MPIRIPWQLADDAGAPFPPADTALREPDGLLAMGGDLQPQRLLNAYAGGIFPWSSADEPLLWWSPDPRAVFETAGFRLSRSNRRQLRGHRWQLQVDTAFDAVIGHCAHIPRPGQHGTWIDARMLTAYRRLHRMGHAHSFQVHADGQLIGGLYGVSVGRMFFAESMFSALPGASKLALAGACHWLAQWQMPLLDAQVHNPHLALLGAASLPRRLFLQRIQTLCQQPGMVGNWSSQATPIDVSSLLD